MASPVLLSSPAASVAVANLHLPSVVKRRGRPKGADTTVIGLSKNKKRMVDLLTFSTLDDEERNNG